MEGILTEKQCEKIIARFLGPHKKTFQINSFTINPLSSQMEGLLGEQYIAEIRFQLEAGKEILQRFFVKILNGKSKVMFELCKSIFAFEKEQFYYATLRSEMRKLKIDVSFAPESYLCENYAVVLDDLSVEGFKGTNKRLPLDLEHCEKCLETLAKFHVASIVYETKFSENKRLIDLHETILEDKFFTSEDNGATRYLKSSMDGLYKLIELVPENGISKTDFTGKLNEVLGEILAGEDTSSGLKSTILHGDLWSNNFLFKYKDGKIIDTKLIDYQTVKYGPPGMDVLQFIFTNTKKAFRDDHFSHLLQHYYRNFTALLTLNNLQPDKVLTIEEFTTTCQLFLIPTKIHATVDRAITGMQDDLFLTAIQNDEKFTKFLFQDRPFYIVESFNTDDKFRELILEDLLELRSMLFAENNQPK